MEVENLIAKGWRPKPAGFSGTLTPPSLAVARMNSSSLSFKFSAPYSSLYNIFVRYFDAVEDFRNKKVIVSLNGSEVGRIKGEGTGKFQIWRGETEFSAGTNIITLTPVSNTPTSDIAFIDYVLITPKLWEEQAIEELESIGHLLTGGEN